MADHSMLKNHLLEAISASDMKTAVNLYDRMLDKGADPWDIHLSLYPAVQAVLNPPFINPHLPKMYAIIREFIPYLEKGDIPSLIRLEIAEYARRPKLKIPAIPKTGKKEIAFSDIETAISYQDLELTANALKSFLEQKGALGFSRNLLLLGSGYLKDSLGHSISCTAFILLEMNSRPGDDPWPALVCLADYLCKGRFDTLPSEISSEEHISHQVFEKELLRAAAGYGIVNLHHTITLYTIDRSRHLFNSKENQHMLRAGIEFMKAKAEGSKTFLPADTAPIDYQQFYSQFAKKDAESVVPMILAMVSSVSQRKRLGRYLIKGLCDLYQGDYNPHYITGLGSTLWVMQDFWKNPRLLSAVSEQYLDFFFGGI